MVEGLPFGYQILDTCYLCFRLHGFRKEVHLAIDAELDRTNLLYCHCEETPTLSGMTKQSLDQNTFRCAGPKTPEGHQNDVKKEILHAIWKC